MPRTLALISCEIVEMQGVTGLTILSLLWADVTEQIEQSYVNNRLWNGVWQTLSSHYIVGLMALQMTK